MLHCLQYQALDGVAPDPVCIFPFPDALSFFFSFFFSFSRSNSDGVDGVDASGLVGILAVSNKFEPERDGSEVRKCCGKVG